MSLPLLQQEAPLPAGRSVNMRARDRQSRPIAQLAKRQFDARNRMESSAATSQTSSGLHLWQPHNKHTCAQNWNGDTTGSKPRCSRHGRRIALEFTRPGRCSAGANGRRNVRPLRNVSRHDRSRSFAGESAGAILSRPSDERRAARARERSFARGTNPANVAAGARLRPARLAHALSLRSGAASSAAIIAMYSSRNPDSSFCSAMFPAKASPHRC